MSRSVHLPPSQGRGYSVRGVMSRGGVIMYVSHEFAMNMTIVPQTFSRMPSVQCPHFARPYFQRSQP